MKYFSLFLLFAEIFFPSNPRIKAKYASLDPQSISHNLAFYRLYPETKEGQLALERIIKLLGPSYKMQELPEIALEPIIALVNRREATLPSISENELELIERLSSHLHNRMLKGHQTFKLEEILLLPPNEIDVARALLLAESSLEIARVYEASLDLMALQIQAHLSPQATPYEKIRAISHFIFHEMRFRFPPQAVSIKDIDVYTFLPSVIDKRRGVCLGVSILYLCLAQRLGLNLQAVTPPGHIYVRYLEEGKEELNIETTARGIHVPSERYLGMQVKTLQIRTLKEVVGLAFMNQASVSFKNEEYGKAIAQYEKALLFLPDDILLQQLLGFNYLLNGNPAKGKELLQKIQNKIPDYALGPDTLIIDYLDQKVDIEGIKAIFMEMNGRRESILAKQKKLEEVLQKYPKFRSGLLALASCWILQGREKEALIFLQKYEDIDPNDPLINYYLSTLSLQRFDYTAAWRYYRAAERLSLQQDHHPYALKELKRQLISVCPCHN